jgi:hypothetical protein
LSSDGSILQDFENNYLAMRKGWIIWQQNLN